MSLVKENENLALALPLENDWSERTGCHLLELCVINLTSEAPNCKRIHTNSKNRETAREQKTVNKTHPEAKNETEGTSRAQSPGLRKESGPETT